MDPGKVILHYPLVIRRVWFLGVHSLELGSLSPHIYIFIYRYFYNLGGSWDPLQRTPFLLVGWFFFKKWGKCSLKHILLFRPLPFKPGWQAGGGFWAPRPLQCMQWIGAGDWLIGGAWGIFAYRQFPALEHLPEFWPINPSTTAWWINAYRGTVGSF